MNQWNERDVVDKDYGNPKGIYDGVDLLYIPGGVSIREFSQSDHYGYVEISDKSSTEIEAYESALVSLELLVDECRATLKELKGDE